MFINVIDNALKYTPDGTDIVLKVQEAGDHVQISIMDNGPGIDDALKLKLFEPFTTGKIQRNDSARGLGLGLALCESILNVHGSEMTVRDNYPTGTIFSFLLKKGELDVHE